MSAAEGVDPAELPVGDDVHHPDYLLMRLRMRLTGTASPDQATWGAALRSLLAHLDEHPLDPGATKADGA